MFWWSYLQRIWYLHLTQHFIILHNLFFLIFIFSPATLIYQISLCSIFFSITTLIAFPSPFFSFPGNEAEKKKEVKEEEDKINKEDADEDAEED